MGLRFSTGIGPLRYSVPLTPKLRHSRHSAYRMTKAEAEATTNVIGQIFKWALAPIALIFILTYRILKWTLIALLVIGIAAYVYYLIKRGDKGQAAHWRETLQKYRVKLAEALRPGSTEDTTQPVR